MDQAFHDSSETTMLIKVPLQVMGLSVLYSAGLGWLERKFPNIKPDHIWAEVAGGVLISLVPVALAARNERRLRGNDPLPWQTYEGAVWRSFFASGAPIILWQIGEAVFRHMELMRYTAYGEGRSVEIDAYSTETLAGGGGERAGADPSIVHEGDSISAGGAEQD